MPYPARTTTVEPAMGLHDKPSRGSMPLLSGRISEFGYLPGEVARTCGAAEKSGVTSRLTSRPFNSLIGPPYSHLAPMLSVSSGRILQSSVANVSATDSLRYLSALPNAIELVVGVPRRK